jgi:hypothetical protein
MAGVAGGCCAAQRHELPSTVLVAALVVAAGLRKLVVMLTLAADCIAGDWLQGRAL